MMRVSWEKNLNPFIRLLSLADRGFLRQRYDIQIPRPNPPSPTAFPHDPNAQKPVPARLFFAGTKEELKKAKSLILQFPGGGFVAMNPRVHEDYLSQWARQTKVPIVSIDYGKAPEHPYPFALEQCFDAYRAIVESNGAVVGLEGWYEEVAVDSKGKKTRGSTSSVAGLGKRKDPIRVIVVGDSAYVLTFSILYFLLVVA
jgi:hypothetical protein